MPTKTDIDYSEGPKETRRPRITNRPTVRLADSTLNCYWGDTHRHSYASKCVSHRDGSVEDHLRYAIESAGYDFHCVTDHLFTITQSDWSRTIDTLDAFTVDSQFVGIVGVEHNYTSHHNFYCLDRDAAWYLYGHFMKFENLRELFDACAASGMRDRLFIARHFHGDSLKHRHVFERGHPDYVDPRFDWVIEGVQMRGFSPTVVNELLGIGIRVGLIGGSDHGSSGGTFERAITGVWSPELSRSALFEAIHQRRTFCTNGPAAAAWISVDGVPMGGAVGGAPSHHIEVSAVPTTRFTRVRILRGTEEISAMNVAEDGPVIVTHDDSDGARATYYRAIVEQEPEPGQTYPGEIWTSPVWCAGDPDGELR